VLGAVTTIRRRARKTDLKKNDRKKNDLRKNDLMTIQTQREANPENNHFIPGERGFQATTGHSAGRVIFSGSGVPIEGQFTGS
jgi:hypothetical protein